MKRYIIPTTKIIEITESSNLMAASDPRIVGNSNIGGVGNPESQDAPVVGGYGDAKRFSVWDDEEG